MRALASRRYYGNPLGGSVRRRASRSSLQPSLATSGAIRDTREAGGYQRPGEASDVAGFAIINRNQHASFKRRVIAQQHRQSAQCGAGFAGTYWCTDNFAPVVIIQHHMTQNGDM